MKARPAGWPQARILLQISFDEFHQEVLIDKHGQLRERIPVAKIANIVELAPRYQGIQLALLHKQNRLNFSAFCNPRCKTLAFPKQIIVLCQGLQG
ncbi:hypothetical protein [Thiolapillus sp.]|uniref:hypothetical protein n=2 Tax=Thiolapillus sp. TaxID=2017437 RepID=UPI003AF47900